MGKAQGCRAEVQGDIGDVVETLPATTTDTVAEAALRALEELENRQIAGCPYCSNAALQRWGKARSKVQRWRCRNCERSFSSTTGTVLAGLHAPGKLRLVLIDMLSSELSSCRVLGEKLTLSAMTIWGWRQRVNQALERIVADLHENIGMEPIAVDTVVLRESRKASREWVDHQRDPTNFPEPDRHRWVDYRERHLPLPTPMTPHLLTVQLTEDCSGNCRATLQSAWQGKPGASAMSTGVIGGPMTTTSNVRRPAVLPVEQHVPPGERLQPQDGEGLSRRFRSFLRPFSGPAKKHLSGYIAWFVAWRVGCIDAHRLDMADRVCRALSASRPTRFWTWASCAA